MTDSWRCDSFHEISYASAASSAVWFSRLVRHPARKRIGSILTTPEAAGSMGDRTSTQWTVSARHVVILPALAEHIQRLLKTFDNRLAIMEPASKHRHVVEIVVERQNGCVLVVLRSRRRCKLWRKLHCTCTRICVSLETFSRRTVQIRWRADRGEREQPWTSRQNIRPAPTIERVIGGELWTPKRFP